MQIIVVHSEPGTALAWQRALAARLPQARIAIDPASPDGQGEHGAPADFRADIAVGWRPAPDFFSRHPHLQAFFSAGAGVDHLLAHPGLPPELSLIRLEDAGMGELMADYCLHEVLHMAGRHDDYARLQAQQRWEERPSISRSQLSVGILGMGVLGTQVAQRLSVNGFTVRGFARTPRTAGDIEVLCGADRWHEFLSVSRVLILLAPLTPDTENLINAQALSRLPGGAWLINVARGALVVDADLIDALDSGQLAGASLDVFRQEPLPASHPFWHHPRIRMTPHVSAPTQVVVSAEQVAHKLLAMNRGTAPSGRVDRGRGY